MAIQVIAGVTVEQTTTIPHMNNSRPLAMSLACAVRGVGLVAISIVTHRLQAARIGRKLFSHVKFQTPKEKQ